MNALAITALAFELGGLIIASVFISPLLDAQFHTKDLFFPILCFASLLAWFIHLAWWVRKIQKNEEPK